MREERKQINFRRASVVLVINENMSLSTLQLLALKA